MPCHLVVYRDIQGILPSLISSYLAASLDTIKHVYLSRTASSRIPLLIDFVWYNPISSCTNRSAQWSGSYLKGEVFPV
jgi:hypothetical protein